MVLDKRNRPDRPSFEIPGVQRTTCCVVGGGPGGTALALLLALLLLARRGTDVKLLEAHPDFDRAKFGKYVLPTPRPRSRNYT